MFTEEQVKELKAPLNAKHVKSRSQAGRNLSYVEGWHVIDEANRIFGFDAWNRETLDIRETSRDLVKVPGYGGKPDYDQWRVSYVARVRISVGAIVRDGTGYGSGMAKPEALGDAIESAIKEAETDAMKRALMTFGNPFGLALYDKEQTNVATDDPPPKPKPTASAKPPAGPAKDTRQAYFATAQVAIEMANDAEKLRGWWKEQSANRREAGLKQADVDDLLAMLSGRLGELEKPMNPINGG